MTICWLICALGSGLSLEFILQPGQKYFSPEIVAKQTKELPWEKTLSPDMESIFSCYPGFIRGVELRQKHLNLILNNGERLIYDDGLGKGFRERLDNRM